MRRTIFTDPPDSLSSAPAADAKIEVTASRSSTSCHLLSAKVTLASGLLTTQSSRTRFGPWTVRAVPAVDFVGEDGRDAAALRRVDDSRGPRQKIGDDTVLEVKGKLRIGGQVRQPVRVVVRGSHLSKCRRPADRTRSRSVAARRTADPGGDVDRTIQGRRGGVDGQRLATVLSHGLAAWPSVGRPSISAGLPG